MLCQARIAVTIRKIRPDKPIQKPGFKWLFATEKWPYSEWACCVNPSYSDAAQERLNGTGCLCFPNNCKYHIHNSDLFKGWSLFSQNSTIHTQEEDVSMFWRNPKFVNVQKIRAFHLKKKKLIGGNPQNIQMMTEHAQWAQNANYCEWE